jgi:hypothetical protein
MVVTATSVMALGKTKALAVPTVVTTAIAQVLGGGIVHSVPLCSGSATTATLSGGITVVALSGTAVVV